MMDLNTQEVMEVKAADICFLAPGYCTGMLSFHALAKGLDQPPGDTPKLAAVQFLMEV